MSKNDTFPFWTDEWMKSQQEYLDTWTDLSEKMTSGFQPAKKPINPWVEALDQWETFIPNTGESQPYAQRMLDQGKAFFEMSDGISKFLKVLNEVNESKEQWQNTLQSQMEAIKKAFETGDSSLAAFWDEPLDSWKSSLGDSPIELQSFMKFVDQAQGMDSLTNPIYDEMNKKLSTPALGQNREAQEQHQKYTCLLMDYQRASQEYNTAHHRVGQEAIERLIAKISEMSKQGESIDTMRGIYDLWVDCAEEAYAEFAFTDEYQTVYGRMINSLMALKQASRNIVDSAMTSIGLPSSKAFDTVLQRMQEMRREIRQLQREKKKSADLSELHNEIAELRKELAAVKKSVSAINRVEKSVSKKTVTKKKAAATKTTKG